VYARERLAVGDEVVGPAVIEEHSSTTLLWPGDAASVADGEELVVRVGAAPPPAARPGTEPPGGGTRWA
jgi:N-methylhydantoinase A